MMGKLEDNFSTPTAFARRLLVHNPNITRQEVQDEWVKQGFPQSQSPTPLHMTGARVSLRKKYDLSDLNQLPIGKKGKVVVSGLLRLLLKKDPSISEARCRELLQYDGLSFTHPLFRQIQNDLGIRLFGSKATEDAKNQEIDEMLEGIEDSPDSKQNSGPRARLKSKKKVFQKKEPYVEDNSVEDNSAEIAKTYRELEDHLDNLLVACKQLKNNKLVEAIKDARRSIIRECGHLV